MRAHPISLDFDVLLDVVSGADWRQRLTAFGRLRSVFPLNLSEIQRALISRVDILFTRGRAAQLVRTDHTIGHGHDQVFDLIAAGLTASQNGLLDVLARRTIQEQLRRRFVQPHGEVKVLHRYFARAQASAHVTGALLAAAE